MIIFSNISELREHVAISASFEFDDIKPSLKQAARKRVVPIIGKTLATEMETYYNNGSPDLNDEDKYPLLLLLQETVANFGVETYIPEGNVTISGQGITTEENEHSKPADWGRIKDLTRKHLQAGESALEDVIDYLETNGNFTAWNNSEERKSLTRFFISSAGQFREYYSQLAPGHLTFKALLPEMQTVQSMYLEPILGAAFLTELKDYTSGTEQKQAQQYARFALANLTISRACRSQLFQFTPDGFRKRLVTTFNSMIDKLSEASKEELMRVEEQAAKTGNAYLQKLEDYLNEKATDSLFGSWKNSDKYTDPTTTEEPSIIKGKGGFVGF